MAYGTGGFLDTVKDLTSMAIAPSPDAYAEQRHPAVIEHPVTGRPALYLNPVYTTRFAGWNPVESQELLAHIYRHATSENFTCRLRWARHTLAIWDNRCTMHNALNDYPRQRREMFRTSVKGAPPSRGLDGQFHLVGGRPLPGAGGQVGADQDEGKAHGDPAGEVLAQQHDPEHDGHGRVEVRDDDRT